jgi:Inner membrane component of T3SS, cytoplasmic domain
MTTTTEITSKTTEPRITSPTQVQRPSEAWLRARGRRDAPRSDRAIPGILQLREAGSGRCHVLPADAPYGSLGTDDACAVRLVDPRVWPVHAHLTRERADWVIRVLGETPGLCCDGERTRVCSLAPGMDLRIGDTVLVAEDARWIALRRFCARMLGWGPGAEVQVDRALRAIRHSMTGRAALVLRGDGDLVPLAQALHRRMHTTERPFVVCDPRRRSGRASVRAPGNDPAVSTARIAAAGGALCVRAERPPVEIAQLWAKICESRADTQLIVCAKRSTTLSVPGPAIDIPPLSARVPELPRIITEYAADAIASLGAPAASFRADDHHWVHAKAARSLAEIDAGTRRLISLRSSANLSIAAARLGMALVSLSRWIARRGLPPHC